MSGLIALAGTRGRVDAGQRFPRAHPRLRQRAAAGEDQWCAPDGETLLGQLRFRPPASPGRDRSAGHAVAPTGPHVAFEGVLHNAPTLCAELARDGAATGVAVDQGGPVDRLLSELYGRDGADFVSRLEGEFALVLVDPARQRVVAATDAAGNHPIFWHQDESGLVVSTDIGVLLAAASGRLRLDLRAVADYLTCGMVVGDKTLVEHVHALPSGSLLLYDHRRSQTTVRRYLDPAAFFQPKATDKRQYLDDVTDAFGRAVRRAIGVGDRVCLSLSGGLDSRAILSAAGGTAAALRTYTLGVPGCADQVIGERLSRLAGTRHTFFPLHQGYLREFVPNMARMVAMTGGMYLSHGLTEMLALGFLEQTDADVLVRGHGGELAKAHLAWPLHTDRHIQTLQSTGVLVDYLAARANYITPRLPLPRLLTPKAALIAGDGAVQSFRDALAGTPLSPADCCSYLYLHEHHRRFTVPSLELFRTKMAVRLPFLDARFLRVLLSAPPEWRASTEIHRRITAAGLPALGAVRDSNTGAPANAGPAATFVFDKMNSVLKRLNVAGYRHYHDFDGWMRRELLQGVEAELLAPTALVQAFVPRPVLASLLQATRTGTGDHSYLLQVLLILELWQRQHDVEAAV